MATEKLGVYVVVTKDHADQERRLAQLVIAESASKAQSCAAFAAEAYSEVVAVGRLGDYDPGLGGVRLAAILAQWNDEGGRITLALGSDKLDKVTAGR